ncbi:MAG: succinate dehydrogenase/fumarate reductase iron-sulfur subunit [Nautilia sp.]|nr:MAG: succinate dehydrogenase/fumarate reductase iron-sulfur subunit [Nautilia sp.]
MIVKIKRGDKFREYEINVDKNWTILEVLEYIKTKIDSTLTFRASCRSSICGSCAMVINGQSKLACKENISKNLINNEITIEPLKKFPVIRDLVVDDSKAYEKLKKVKPYLTPKTPPKNSEFLIKPEEVASYDKQTDCILCMACYSDCAALDVDENYLGPFQFTKTLRFINDSRDNTPLNERLDLITKEGNIFECLECQACILACPKGVTPQFDIKKLQNIALQNGYQNPNPPQNDFNSFNFGGFNEGGFF